MRKKVKLTQKALSFFLAVALIFGGLPIGMVQVHASNGVFAGSGSENDPYQIDDLADLNALASKVNSGELTTEDVYFKQTEDIEIIGDYMVIGTDYNHPFEGTYDGGGFEISGRIEIDGKYAAVFGSTNNAIIKNLGVSAEISGNNHYAAGIVGYASYSTIENCYNTGNVSGYYYFGGIVGSSFADKIKNCYNTGDISGTNCGGGITGSDTYSTIENCYNTGNISVSDNFAGGLVGKGGSSTKIYHCYSIGDVIGEGYNVGPLAGNLNNELLKSAYYNKEKINETLFNYDGVALTSEQMTGFGALNDMSLDDEIWTVKASEELGEGISSKIINYYPVLKNNEQDPASFETSEVPVSLKKFFKNGAGSQEIPFEIPTLTELNALSDLVSAGELEDGVYFKQTADIEIVGDYTPIGQGDAKFKGNYDGGGFEISGTINSSQDSAAVFGSIENSTIKNLGNSANVMAQLNAAGIVCYASNSTIMNCYNKGNVSSSGEMYWKAAGIVGSSSNSTIEKCYNTGKISGRSYVAGIVGSCSSNSTIENCYNTGVIRGLAFNDYSIGGIAGSVDMSNALNCYNVGDVANQDGVNQSKIFGSFGTASTYTNCYYNLDNVEDNGSSLSGEGLTTEEMSGLLSLNNMSFDSAVWTTHENQREITTDFDKQTCFYPTLKSNEQEPAPTKVVLNVFNFKGAFENGDGSKENPYEISTLDELKNLAYLVNDNIDSSEGVYFKQTANIEIIGKYSPIGTETKMFKGNYDGNGFQISGIIDRKDINVGVGVFGYTDSATIKNLGVSVNVYGNKYVGGVVGRADRSTIENCYSTGDISAEEFTVGGIVGYAYDGSTITNCYNTGDISGKSDVGGIVGRPYQNVRTSNCYSVGSVTATSNTKVGPIYGNAGNNSKINNCYYNIENIKGTMTDNGGTASITEKMSGSTSLRLMSFDNSVWKAHSNEKVGEGKDSKTTYFYPTLISNEQTPPPSDILTDTAGDAFGFDTTLPELPEGNPYGAKDNAIVSAQVRPELFLSVTDDEKIENYLYDWDKYSAMFSADSKAFIEEDKNHKTFTEQFDEQKSSAKIVSFDPLGTGKDEYIARHVMSFNYQENENSYHKLEIIDASNGSSVYRFNLNYPKHLCDELKAGEIENFIPVVAGDFDGDGRDEVAVYDISAYYGLGNESVSEDQKGVIRVYDFGNGSSISSSPSITTIDLTDYSGFASAGDDLMLGGNEYVGVQMTTAHLLDGSECEDLVLTLNYNSDQMAQCGENGSRVLVYEGSELEKAPKIDTGHIDELSGENRKLRAASTVVGDVDNDAQPDIIIAGVYSVSNESLIHYDEKIGSQNAQIQKNYIAAFNVNDDEDGFIHKSGNEWELNGCKPYKISSGDGGLGKAVHPVAVATFSADGMNTDDLVFLNGRVYRYSEGGSFKDQNTEAEWEVVEFDDKNNDYYFIDQVVVGNMVNDDLGREMIVYTYGCVDGDEDGFDHSRDLGIGSMFYDNYEGAWEIVSTRIKKSDLSSLSIATPDTDNDGVLMRLDTSKETKSYFTDPKIVAVLQAAPRFEAIDAVDGNYATDGHTLFGSSQGTGTGTSNSLAVTAGVTIGYEYESSVAGVYPLNSFEISAGVTTSFTKEFEQEKSVTKSITYESSSDEDRVALTMVPYTTYYYQMYTSDFTIPESEYYELIKIQYDMFSKIEDKNYETQKCYDYCSRMITLTEQALEKGYTYGSTVTGTWQDFEVSIPGTPRNTMMTVEKYDSVAKQIGWNTLSENVLPKNYEIGNPYSYLSSSHGLDNWDGGSAVGIANSDFISLGTGGGSIAQTIDMENSDSKTTSFGGEVSAEMVVGAGGFKFGVNASLGEEEGNTTITSSGKSYEGSVRNVPSDCDDYNFNWQFGTYTVPYSYNGDSDESYDCRVLGYLVKEVDSPVDVPRNFHAEDITENSFTLAWDAPFQQVDKYNIYIYNEGAELEYYLLKSVNNDVFELEINNLVPDREFYYVIQGENVYGEQSIYSAVLKVRTSSENSDFGVTISVEKDDKCEINENIVSTIPSAQSLTFNLTTQGVSYIGSRDWQIKDSESGQWVSLGYSEENPDELVISDLKKKDYNNHVLRCMVTSVIGGVVNKKASNEITISTNAKINPTYTVPSDLVATYGDTLESLTLSENFTFEDELDTLVGDVGERIFKVTYTPENTTDYNIVNNIDVTVTVQKATPSVTAPVAKSSLVYNGTAQALVEDGTTTGGQMMYSLNDTDYYQTLPVATNAGTHTVYYKVIGGDNYNDIDAESVDVTIARKTIDEDLINFNTDNLIYNGQPQQSLTTDLVENVDYTVLYENNTNAGTANVTVTGTGNYTGEIDKTFEIGKFAPTVTVEASKKVVKSWSGLFNAAVVGLLGDYEDGYIVEVRVVGVNGEKPTGTVSIMDNVDVMARDLEVVDGVAVFDWEDVTANKYYLTAHFTSSDNNYKDMTSAEVGYAINKADQKIEVEEIANKTFGDADFNVQVNGIKENAQVNYIVTSGNATVTQDGLVSLTGAGDVTIKVVVESTKNYNSFTTTVSFAVADAPKGFVMKTDVAKACINGEAQPTTTSNNDGHGLYHAQIQFVESRTLLPIRYVAQTLGLEVGYDQYTGLTTISNETTTVKIVQDSSEIIVVKDGVETTVDAGAASQYIRNVSHIPNRAVLVQFGFSVNWDNNGYLMVTEYVPTAKQLEVLLESAKKTLA